MQENFNPQENKETKIPPKVGEQIYVPRKESFDYPLHDVDGGLAVIESVKESENGDYIITVAERPNKEYSYKNLLLQQDYLQQEFAGKIAKPNPDHKVYPEDNDWKGGTEEDRKKWLDNQ